MSIGSHPLAVRHDDTPTIPAQHLVSRATGWRAIDKRQAPFQRRASLILGEAVEARQETPPSPVLPEEAMSIGAEV